MEKYRFSEDLRIMQEKSLQFAYEQSLQKDFVGISGNNDELSIKNDFEKTLGKVVEKVTDN